jgi:integrase
MNLVDYPDDDGMKVWLDRNEVELLLNEATDTEQKIAFLFGVRSGLRVSEIVGTGDRPGVRPSDIVETTAGPRVRVWNAKGGKHRESPAPPELVHTVGAYADARREGSDIPLVDRVPRTVERWVARAAERLQERTGDDGWAYLTPHDLRRTWATMLAADEVDPLLVCDWGGWEDIEVFLDHYRGSYSPEVQRRELEKVDWLGGSGDSPRDDGEAPATTFELNE